MVRRRRVIILVAAGVVALVLWPHGDGRAPRERPDVFIFLVDALRADHVGCYGYDRPSTPNIDAFAEQALLFEQAQAPCSWTRPSVTSIFTGLYPWAHGTRKNTDGLARWAVPVTELLAESGYATALISANPNITVHTGFDRGLDEFVHAHGAPADELTAEAARWLRSVPPDTPVFLYLHAMEPHLPYAPSPETFARFDTGAAGRYDGSQESLADLPTFSPELSEADVRHLVDLYDAEVCEADAGFARFLAMLEALGREEGALIVFVADHGEAFCEHDTIRHGHILSQEVVRVPLLVRYPDGRGAGARVSEPVSLVALFSTVAEETGLSLSKLPYPVQAPALRAQPAEECVFADVYSAKIDLDLGAVIARDGSRYVAPLGEETPPEVAQAVGLWDFRKDPHEQDDLVARDPARAAQCHERLASWISSQRPGRPGAVEMDQELREELRALGYL